MNSDYFDDSEKDFLVNKEGEDYQLYCRLVGRKE